MGSDHAEIDPGFCRHTLEFTSISHGKGPETDLFTFPLARSGQADRTAFRYHCSTVFPYMIAARGDRMISASEARQRLFPLLEQVNTDHQPVRITSKAGDAVLMSADDYDSWQETVYLLRSPESQATDGSGCQR